MITDFSVERLPSPPHLKLDIFRVSASHTTMGYDSECNFKAILGVLKDELELWSNAL